MARKSRKIIQQANIQDVQLVSSEDIQTPNKTAIYTRLSLYDLYRPDPDSMKYQIIFVKEYVDNHPDLHLVDTYVDNGHSGINYERPAFKRLIEDIYAGKINCVVVKDLSRFGRNYIETGMYLQEIFPEQHVRFIAINDEYDSKYNSSDDLAVILKNILNDFYSRELSRKVSNTYDILVEEGNFLGNLYPLGYKKDPDLPGHYIKDPETAIYIELLFEWYQEGLSMTQIAARFTDLNVPSSSRIRYMRSKNRKKLRNKGHTHWNATTIKQILSNPVYVGDVALRKSQNRRYTLEGPKTFDRSEWIIRENVHEPYISRDLYNRILEDIDYYKELNTNRKKDDHSAKQLNPYRSFIKCGVCGYTMNFHHYKLVSGEPGTTQFTCYSQHYANRMRGHRVNISGYQVHYAVYNQLLTEFQQADTLFSWLQSPRVKSRILQYIMNLENQLRELKETEESFLGKKAHLLELYNDHVLNKEDFTLGLDKLYADHHETQTRIEQLHQKKTDDSTALSAENPWLLLFSDQEVPPELGYTIVKTYFQEITVYPDEQITCAIAEEEWRDRLLLLYQELEE